MTQTTAQPLSTAALSSLARQAGSPSAASFSGMSSRENSSHGSEAAKMADSFLSVKRVSGRWQRATGEDAVHAVTGERFDDLAQRLLPPAPE